MVELLRYIYDNVHSVIQYIQNQPDLVYRLSVLFSFSQNVSISYIIFGMY